MGYGLKFVLVVCFGGLLGGWRAGYDIFLGSFALVSMRRDFLIVMGYYILGSARGTLGGAMGYCFGGITLG